MRNITTHQKGCSDTNGAAQFLEETNFQSNAISSGGQLQISVVKLDDYLLGKHVNMIKMDIEGSELSALKGASQVIAQDRPVLAISVYHKKEDLIVIPQYIKEITSGYKFYLRLHTIICDLVLYAVPDEYRYLP
jgi:hypothetical protein